MAQTKGKRGERGVGRRRSRRTFAAGLAGMTGATIAASGLLAACNRAGGESATEGQAARVAEPQEIEVWVTNYPPVVEAYKSLVEQFQREHPRVRVTGGEGVAKTGNADTLIPAVTGGTPPHAAELNQPNTWSFAGQNVYAPLNEYVKRDKVTSQAMADFYPGQLEAVTWRDQTYFFPVGVSMEVWHANQSFWKRAGIELPRAGWTWNDLANAYGPKLQGAVGPEGSAFMMELNEMYRMLAFVKQNGGDMLDKSGTKLTIAEPASVEAFEFVRGLVAKGILVEQNKEKTNFRLDGLNVALELEGMTRIPVYRKALGTDQAWVPGPKQKVRANVYDSWVVGLVRNDDPKKMEAAYQWLAWLIQPEHNLAYQKARANLPPRRAVTQLPNAADLWGSEPLIKAAMDDLNYGTTFPFTPATGLLRTALNQQALPLILRDGQPVSQTLKQVVPLLESQYGALLK
ncbi:MAG TPA: extracellular solute-binding protein [Chloroflexota bacterium]|nr:extracellular solute-binding protein [Chloroflexota bacterium]